MPPDIDVVGRLIRINRLNVGDLRPLTIGFRITDRPDEKWTDRFNRFKYGEGPAVEAAMRAFCTAFEHIRYPEDPRIVVVSAISSGHSTVDPHTPAACLGRSLMDSRGWEWRTDLLSKRPHPRISGLRTAYERDAAVNGVYSATPIEGDPGIVLIVDDFCTRGATLADIARAIRQSNPRWAVSAACLAKTERARFWQGTLSNKHIPDELENAWCGYGRPS